MFTNNSMDGDFYVEDVDYIKAFESFSVSYLEDGYISNYAEVLDDVNKTTNYYAFHVDWGFGVYLLIDFYPSRMYPTGCRSGSSSKG